MQNPKLTLLRLSKEERQLIDEPLPGVIVKREGTFNFHFCIYELEAPYEGGIYHGVLQLSQNYPFAAPKLIFFTPTGRFEVNIPICTTFTHYHQQSWTSAWNVRSMVLATISFMCSDEPGYGCKVASDDEKRRIAQQSLNNNVQNPLFRQLFSKELQEKGITIPNELSVQLSKSVKPQSKPLKVNKQRNPYIQDWVEGITEIVVNYVLYTLWK